MGPLKIVRRSAGFSLLCAAGLIVPAATMGQALEPRLYSNAPIGMNFLVGGYSFMEGSIADPSIQLEDGELQMHTAIMAYAHSFGVFGKSAKFDVVVPYGYLSGTAMYNGSPVSRYVDGFADPQFRVSMNFIGAPALSLAEFMEYKQNFVMGASLKVTPPLGQYDRERLVNIGAHRWSVQPELGMSKAFGRFSCEAAGAVIFYSDNEDFYGGNTRSQDPIGSVQAHLVYTFKTKIWVAVSGTYYAGGRSTLNGVEKSDLQQNTRLGAVLAIPVNKKNSIKLFMNSGVSARTGTDFDTYGVAWQYRWGGGL